MGRGLSRIVAIGSFMFGSTTCGKAGIWYHAAIYKQRGAGHVVGRLGGQPNRGLGNVFGPAYPPVRHERHEVQVDLGRVPGFGIDRCGCNGGDAVDSDEVWRQRRMGLCSGDNAQAITLTSPQQMGTVGVPNQYDLLKRGTSPPRAR